jgi:two-component system OmpR family response regulator
MPENSYEKSGRFRILAVDTDRNTLESLKMKLTFEFDVETAENIEDVVSLFLLWKPHVIISTDDLPRFRVEKLIRLAKHFDLDVIGIVMTERSDSFDNYEDKLKLYNAGFHLCIDKRVFFDYYDNLKREINTLLKFKLQRNKNGKNQISSPKILLVDDDVQALEWYEYQLLDYGCEVVTTISGKDALELFVSFKPDVIISDLNLHDISGNELIKRIRELNTIESRNVLAIVISGWARGTKSWECFNSGFDKYYEKVSINWELLVSEINSIINL